MKKNICLFLTIFISLNSFTQYNYYYGSLHSHSGFSDGNQDSLTTGYTTPSQNFNFVKATYHVDFWGISDHNHYLAGMQSPQNYRTGLQSANAANNDGTFVCLYGMEWGVISGGGHIVTYGIDSLIGWDKEADNVTNDYDIYCAKNDYTSYWNILNARPNSFSTLAHPNSTDFGNIAGTVYNSIVDNVIYGCAYRSGAAASSTTNYTDATPNTSYEPYWQSLLAKGYHLGPTIDADNHNTNFGRHNKCRTGILATSLTKANVIDAYKKMRFYASEDWNAQVDFSINGNVMGSQFLTSLNSSISVNATDLDPTESIAKIQIYYGVPGSGAIPTILTSNTNSSTLNFTHNTTVGNIFYYYAKITEADGDVIITSPVWVNRTVVTPTNFENFTGELIQNYVQLNWKFSDSNIAKFIVEKSLTGNTFSEIGTVFNNEYTSINNFAFQDYYPNNNIQYYRIKVIKSNGEFYFSNTIPIKATISPLNLIKVYPQPVLQNLWIKINSTISQNVVAKVYEIGSGREMMSFENQFNIGENNIKLNTILLSKGTYVLVLSIPNQRLLEIKFVK